MKKAMQNTAEKKKPPMKQSANSKRIENTMKKLRKKEYLMEKNLLELNEFVVASMIESSALKLVFVAVKIPTLAFCRGYA